MATKNRVLLTTLVVLVVALIMLVGVQACTAPTAQEPAQSPGSEVQTIETPVVPSPAAGPTLIPGERPEPDCCGGLLPLPGTPLTATAIGTVCGYVATGLNPNCSWNQFMSAGVALAQVDLVSPGPDGNLYTTDDVVVQTRNTGADGCYAFQDVELGDYLVKVPMPSPIPVTACDGDTTPDGQFEVSLTTANPVATAINFGY